MLDDLETVTQRSKPYAKSVELRGEGPASFIFATGNGRAVEISIDDGAYWVEYWNDLDEDSLAAFEKTLVSADELEDSLRGWIGSPKG